MDAAVSEREAAARTLEKLRQDLDESLARLAGMQDDLETTAQREQSLHDELKAATSEKVRATEALAALESERDGLHAELEAVRSEQEQMQVRVGDAKAELEAELEKLRTQLSEQATSYESALAEHLEQLAGANAAREQLEGRVGELEALVGDKDHELTRLREALSAAESSRNEQAEALQVGTGLTNKLERECKAWQGKLESAEAHAQDLAAELKQVRAQLEDGREQQEQDKVLLAQTRLAAQKAQAERDAAEARAKQSQEELAKLHERLTSVEKELKQVKVSLADRPEAPARPEEPDAWYLRYDEDNLLGPVTFDELLSWAKDCRVSPDHYVSSDKIFWAKASEVSGLEMEWMVPLVDGTPYGPINKHAVNDLMADEAVLPDAELTHVRTGEKVSAATVRQD